MEKPRYKTLRRFLLTRKGEAPKLFEPDQEVEYDGLPSENLEPLNKAAEDRVAEAAAVFAKQRRDAAIRSAPGGDALAEALAELLAGAVSRKSAKAKAEAA